MFTADFLFKFCFAVYAPLLNKGHPSLVLYICDDNNRGSFYLIYQNIQYDFHLFKQLNTEM